MLRATTVLPAGSYPAASDTVVLDFDERRRRRIVMQAESGLEFLLDLAETPALAPGDGLKLEDGRVVTVAARPERLAEFRFADKDALARVAWHLGNRHTPTEFAGNALRIRDDHVLVEMVKKMGGAEIGFVDAAFTPEGGAYGVGATMGHDHGHAHSHGHAHDHGHVHTHADGTTHSHDHDHDHTHSHDGAHDHDHAEPEVDPELLAAAQARRAARKAARAATEHVHGPDCGCGHDHHHDYDHDHGHARDHDHAHGEGCGCGHDHSHDHDHDHGHKHAHGEGCGCGHDHSHDHGHSHDHDHKHG
jgi:urease accessory protein